jgi:hypothetical protein
VAALLKSADDPATASVRIDVGTMTVTCGCVTWRAAPRREAPSRQVAVGRAGERLL